MQADAVEIVAIAILWQSRRMAQYPALRRRNHQRTVKDLEAAALAFIARHGVGTTTVTDRGLGGNIAADVLPILPDQGGHRLWRSCGGLSRPAFAGVETVTNRYLSPPLEANALDAYRAATGSGPVAGSDRLIRYRSANTAAAVQHQA